LEQIKFVPRETFIFEISSSSKGYNGKEVL